MNVSICSINTTMVRPGDSFEDKPFGAYVSDLIFRLIQDAKEEQSRSNIELNGRLKPSQFLSKVQILDEYCQGIVARLANSPLEKYKYLWLIQLNNLVSKLISYTKYFSTKFSKDLKNDNNDSVKELFGQVGAIMGKLVYSFNEKLVNFLSDDVVDTILKTDSNQVVPHFTNLINESMELMLTDKCSEMQYLDNSLIAFDKIQQALFQYYHSTAEHSFELFVQFIECSYLIGESKVLIPFFATVASPKLGLLAIKSTSIKLIDLLDYYKYMAFNLVALSLQAFESADTNLTTSYKKYNNEAEIYFRILLNFPNLSTHIYTNSQFGKPEDLENELLSKEKPDNLIMSLSQRQEIAWLYIINNLLRSTTLQQLSEPNHYIQQEFVFLNKSLPASLSKDIHMSASRHGSAHSSGVNITQLAHNPQTPNWKPTEFTFMNKLRLQSLSTIFIDGTYKEKSNLIVNFLRLFNSKNTISISSINDKFGGQHDEDSIFKQSIGEETKGKILYINAIDRICLIITGAAIKYLVQNTGLNNVSVLALTKLTNCKSSIFDALNITESLEYKTDGDIVSFSIPSNVPFNTMEVIAQQVQINESTVELDRIAALLK